MKNKNFNKGQQGQVYPNKTTTYVWWWCQCLAQKGEKTVKCPCRNIQPVIRKNKYGAGVASTPWSLPHSRCSGIGDTSEWVHDKDQARKTKPLWSHRVRSNYSQLCDKYLLSNQESIPKGLRTLGDTLCLASVRFNPRGTQERQETVISWCRNTRGCGRTPRHAVAPPLTKS